MLLLLWNVIAVSISSYIDTIADAVNKHGRYFNGGSAKSLKIRYGWLITSHGFMWRLLITHALDSI